MSKIGVLLFAHADFLCYKYLCRQKWLTEKTDAKDNKICER